jgi:hypothetical protein
MKNLTSGKKVLCALSLCALFGATAAQAQTYSVRVDVPFQFMAANRTFPAGEYDFVVDNSIHALKIQSRAETSIRLVPLTPGTERRSGSELENGMVRFSKIGDQHFLKGVWRAGAADGSVTYPSRAAKEAAKTGHQATTEISTGNL